MGQGSKDYLSIITGFGIMWTLKCYQTYFVEHTDLDNQ